tara:strand:- start:178 stop:600 length:423 start_codon:yes stop_codon:yes gene_type:complete
MLKKINPILGPEVLFVLREMGHGDQIALVDGNYPASAHANKLIRADGIELIPLLDSILDILPIDERTDAIVRAINVTKSDGIDPIHKDIEKTCSDYNLIAVPLDADSFYKRVKNAFAVIATTERSLYANVILTKGVILPK